MAVVAEFTLPSDELPLGTVFEERPGVTVKLDEFVPTNHALAPYFWMHDVDSDEVRAAFPAHPGIVDVTLVDSVGDDSLLRAEWNPEGCGVLPVLAEGRPALLSATGTCDGWTFEVRGDSRQHVSDLVERLGERGVRVDLTSLHDLRPPSSDEYDLTDAQLEALRIAHDHGYFETPRAASLEDLADELGISRQALGSRIRRGLDHLLDCTLAGPDGD